MKRILIVCLLGMGLLLPVQQLTANGFLIKRIVDVYIESHVLGITSDSNTGTLASVKIKNADNQTVWEEGLSGYSDSVDLSRLNIGYYTAYVTTSLTTYTEVFYVN